MKLAYCAAIRAECPYTYIQGYCGRCGLLKSTTSDTDVEPKQEPKQENTQSLEEFMESLGAVKLNLGRM